MITKTPIYPSRLFKVVVIITSLFLLGITTINAQGFKTIVPLTPITATAGTGEKPQSKVWTYQGYWFTVIPVTGGTYIYRLDGTSWTQILLISNNTNVKADVKSVDNITHILLKNSEVGSSIPKIQDAELISVQYVPGSPPSYEIWSVRPTTELIPLDFYAETATIDIDSQNRMWLASDGGGTSATWGLKKINVRWSDYPYTIWSDSITIASSVSYDDICSITSFSQNSGNSIGVFWSNQNTDEWNFAYHLDSDSVAAWTYENPADAGLGKISDDHINLAVHSNGTIYTAVKTSFDEVNTTQIGLLVRHPDGTWDPLYTVATPGDAFATSPTRPIALLSESNNTLTILYSSNSGGSANPGDNLLYKETSLNSISFPNRAQYLRYGTTNYNDISSTKQNYSDSVVIVFTNGPNSSTPIWNGVVVKRNDVSTNNGAGYSLNFDGIDDVLRVENNPSIDLTGSLTIEAWVKPDITRYQVILNKITTITAGAGYGYYLALNSSGKVWFKIDGTALLSSSDIIADGNTWTHIAATYNSFTGSMDIYINGILDASTTAASLSSNTTTLLIGSLTSSFRYIGSLDEIRLWNTGRTADEIRADMCKKLTGSESNLVGCWNFNTPEGLNVPDQTANNNYATMYDMDNYVYSWSGAAIGDESAYDYDLLGGFTQTVSHPDGDTFLAEAASGFVLGLQVYRVDASPLRPGAINNSIDFTNIDTLRYWGVKIIGTSNPTYNVTYNYSGHPGIINENNLNLLNRDNLSVDSWSDLLASLNTSTNTITKTGLTGTEFALAYSETNSINLNLKVFLEGPYNGAGGMTTYLNSNNLIPLNSDSAYSTAAYGYTASIVGSIPNADIVDWVLVEIRTGLTSATTIAKKAAFLKSDGSIVDVDGISPLSFSGINPGNYYVVVRHRNHLAIMSSSAITLGVSSPLYDFTTSQTQAYTSGTDPMVSLSDGAFGMLAGDTNDSNIITAADFTPVIINLNTVAYSGSDVNMSAVITAADFTKLILNLNKATNVPN